MTEISEFSPLARRFAADYDPLRHLIDNRHIAAIPDHPERLLRWFPHEGVRGERSRLSTVREAHVRADQQHEHLEIIRSTGLRVPRIYDTFVAKGPGDEEIRVFNIVETIGAYTHLRSKEHKSQIHNKISKYFMWALTTDQPIILADIFTDHQYKVSGNEPVLMDVDPLFAPTTYPTGQPTETIGFVREYLRQA